MSELHNPKVSIVTATYNHERFIAACLNSVLGQTYTNWEQIIIDDGSCDRTQSVIASFRDSRFRYHFQENQGPFELAHTYNRALSLAKGDVIAILEGDDFWPPDKLASLVPAFVNERVVLAYGDRADVDAQGRRQRCKTETARRRESVADSILFNSPIGSATRYMLLSEGRSLVGPCTVLIRRSALEKIGGFQYVAGLPLTDYPTFLELSLAGEFSFSRRISGYFRRHQNSITNNNARVIHQGVSEFAKRFVEKHAGQIALTPRDWALIERSWREAEDKLNFAEGRVLLLQESWPKARDHFRMALRSKRIKVLAASLTGFFLSLAHRNMESIMRIGGRSDLRPGTSHVAALGLAPQSPQSGVDLP